MLLWEKPDLLGSVNSASSAWTANAATVSPSADTLDGKVHITPANLSHQYHRSLEVSFTHKILKLLFNNSDFFSVHEPLPSNGHYGDEGAANHSRLCPDHASTGLEIFVYGCEAVASFQKGPKIFRARQTFEASLAISHYHKLDPKKTCFLQQNPDCIDKGVFHNDVIAVANQNVFLCHALAYDPEIPFIEKLKTKYLSLTGDDLNSIVISQDDLSLEDAVATYFFNSQLVSLPSGEMVMVLPMECQEHPGIQKLLDKIKHGDNPSLLF